MSLKTTILSSTLIVSLFTGIWSYDKANKSIAIIHNIDYIDAAQSFILATQKTRGLTNSYRNGNASAQLLAYSERDAIRDSVEKMDSIVKQGNIDPNILLQQNALVKTVEELNDNAFKEKPSIVFENYTTIINTMMSIAQNNENTIVSLDTTYKPLSTTMFPLIENIAKLRGLGSGCVARGHCENNESLKLTHFVTQIDALQKRIKKSKDVNHLLYSIERYTTLASIEVIEKKVIAINPDFYFDQGTATINTIVDYTNRLQDEKKAVAMQEHKLYLAIAMSLIFLAVLVLIAMILTRAKKEQPRTLARW